MTAPRRNADRSGYWQRQTSGNIDALSERLTGNERSVVNLSDQFGSFQRDTNTRFDNLTARLELQFRDISAKIDTQSAAYGASGRTNWTAFFGSAATVVGVIATIGAMAIVPLSRDIYDNKLATAHIIETMFPKADAAADEAALIHRIERIGDYMVPIKQYDESMKRVDERYKITEDGNSTRLGNIEKRVSEIDSQLVKRPELEAQSHAVEAANKAQDDKTAMAINSLMQRVDSLSARQTGFDVQLNSLFPLSKVLDELWAGQREQRIMGVPGPPK